MNLEDYFYYFCYYGEELSYNNICYITGEDKKNSAHSKSAQIKRWNKIARIEKKKSKYLFIEMRTNEEKINDMINDTYETLLETFLCTYLKEIGGSTNNLTLPDLLTKVGLVNGNYNIAKFNSDKIGKLIENNLLEVNESDAVNSVMIDDFIGRTEPNYRSKIKQALKKLKNANVVEYNEYVYYVINTKDPDAGKEYSTRKEPTDKEVRQFIDVKNKTLKTVVDKYNKTHSEKIAYDYTILDKSSRYYYYKLLATNLKSDLGWDYYGYKYKIIAGENALENNLNVTSAKAKELINNKTMQILREDGNLPTLINWLIDDECSIDMKEKLLN